MRIQVQRDNQVFGPYTLEEARSYVTSGFIQPSDLVQWEGSGQWVPLPAFPELAGSVPPYAPTPAVLANRAAPVPPGGGVRLGPVLRDVAIIWMLTMIGGFIIGVSGAGGTSPRAVAAIALSNVLLGTIGFVISGCLAPARRWNHLAAVALGVWITGLVNVAIMGITLMQWAASAVLIALMMGLGGALSYLFRRE